MKNDFAKHVTGFFSNYLSAGRGVSPNTMRSYGASFASFLDFMKEKKGTTAERLTLDHMNRKNVLEFLDWIQSGGCSVSTRNQRLAALHAFCKYMQYEDVGRLQQWQEVMSIKIKKTIKGTMNYLTLDGMKHLLSVIPTNTRRGRRNLALLSTLYETGARVQELIGLRPVDISLNQPCHAVLFGKGRKKRIVPLQDAHVGLLKSYMEENRLLEEHVNQRPIFQNDRGGKLTGAGITYILKNYASIARGTSSDLIPEKISPHSLRHSKAMHLLQAGLNLVYIRDILGHVSYRQQKYMQGPIPNKKERRWRRYTCLSYLNQQKNHHRGKKIPS